jgi:hypothetical protein
MATVTLGQASKMTKLSKTTLNRHIKSGRLSAVRNDDGSYSLDTSELARCYTITPVTVANGVTILRDDTPTVTPDMELKLRLAVAEERIKSLSDMLDEVRKSRDDAVHLAKQNQQLLLSYEGKKGFLKRIFGG